MMETAYSTRGVLFFMLAVALVVAVLFFRENKHLDNIYFAKEEQVRLLGEAVGALELEAKSASVYDINSDRVIYGKDDDNPMPLASLAKTMTVALALSQHDPDDVITISKSALDQKGDFGLFLAEKWKVADLAKLTLMVSANDGAQALSEGDSDFVLKMNEKARRLGMRHSFFLNATGLDIVSENALELPQVGAFSSALDANLLAAYGMQTNPEIFSVTTKPELTLTSESGFTHIFKNTDTIVEKIPNLLYSKTGFTDTAGGNLTIVFKNKDGHLIAVTVLGSSFEGRFTDMEKIVNALYNF